MRAIRRLALMLGLLPALAWPAVPVEDPPLELHLDRSRVYPEQPVAVSIRLKTGPASVRDVSYPRLTGPDGPIEFQANRAGGQDGDGYEFTGRLVPHAPGRLSLGPAELDLTILTPASGASGVFGGTESRKVTLRSPTLEFTVLALPDKGRPAGFSGAIGRFRLERVATPRSVRAGEPVTLVTRITGVGNLYNLACPTEDLPGLRAYPPSTRRIANQLVCEQVAVPATAGHVDIPAQRFSYFDPASQRYRSLAAPTITITVLAPEQPPAPAAVPAATSGGSLAAVWGVAAAAMGLGLLSVRIWLRRQNRPSRTLPGSPASRRTDCLTMAERALTSGDVQGFYEAVFRSLQRRSAKASHRPAPGIAAAAPGLDEAAHKREAWLYSECDAVRYGLAVRDRTAMARALVELASLLD